MHTTLLNSRCTRHSPTVWLATWILVTAIAVFVTLALPALLGRVYIADDLGEFHLPLRQFYAQQLARGEGFDWMPSLYGGFYVSGEGQLGAYHPLHWILYRWLPLSVAFNIELMVSYPLLFAGTFFLLRRLIDSTPAALYGTLTFTIGGFCVLHFVHPNAIAVVAHVPWLLWASCLAIDDRRSSTQLAGRIGVALLTTSQLLLGYPQYVWFSMLAEAAFIGWQISQGDAGWKSVGMLALFQAAGICMASIQLLPTFEVLQHSLRQTADAAFSATGSLHPLNLVQLLAPYLFRTRVVGQNTHELGLYIGAMPLVLILWLLANRHFWGTRAALVKALIGFLVLALLLALGEYAELNRIQAWLPLVNRFRFPCRAIVLVQLCSAGLAAIGLELLIEQAMQTGTNRLASRLAPIVFAWIGSVALAAIGPRLWPDYVAASFLVWCGPVLIGAAAALLFFSERGHRAALAAIVAFTAVDLAAYGFSYSILGKTATLNEYIAATAVPPGSRAARMVADEAGSLRTGDRLLLAGVVRVDGYAGLEPKKLLDYRTNAARQLAGVEWVLTPAQGSHEPSWQPIAAPVRRARLLSRFAEPDALEDPARLVSENLAVAESALDLPSGEPGIAELIDDRPGHIVVRIQAPAPQLLVMTESFHPGWVAKSAGRKLPVVRVNGDFLGCVVDADVDRVVLEFRPASLRWGAALSACGLGFLVCLAMFSLLGRYQDSGTTEPCQAELATQS